MGNDPKGSTEEKIGIFEEKKAALMAMAGEKMVRKQHEPGNSPPARESIASSIRGAFRRSSFS